METILEIENIRCLCDDNTIVMTQHVVNRVNERGIKYDDIKNAVLNAEIIEEYPNRLPISELSYIRFICIK